jgi:TonB family protein
LAQPICHFLILALLNLTPISTALTHEATQQQNAPTSRGTAACTFKLLSETEGVDFDFYLRDLYLSVRKPWTAKMPSSVVKGQKGTNTVEFRVLQDGSVPKDSLKIVASSEKDDFDEASLMAVRNAAPFNHLPDKFSKPDILLRFTFYYNLPLPSAR